MTFKRGDEVVFDGDRRAVVESNGVDPYGDLCLLWTVGRTDRILWRTPDEVTLYQPKKTEEVKDDE